MAGNNKHATLLSNASTTGSSVFVKEGGRYTFRIDGTFNGATAQLQILSPSDPGDESVWMDVEDGAFTAEGAVTVEVSSYVKYRVEITGSPSGMYASFDKVSS